MRGIFSDVYCFKKGISESVIKLFFSHQQVVVALIGASISKVCGLVANVNKKIFKRVILCEQVKQF